MSIILKKAKLNWDGSIYLKVGTRLTCVKESENGYKVINPNYDKKTDSEYLKYLYIHKCYTQEPKKEFILPEKWWVEVKSQKEFKSFVNWAVDNNTLNSMHKGWDCYVLPYYVCNNYYEDCKQITFEQFEKYVLKKEVTKEVTDNTQIIGKYYSIKQIESQLLKDYDKSDVKDIIESIKKIK